jgi:hypothetical protein
MKTKAKIEASILRGAVAMLLFSCVIVVFCSAINLPNHAAKVPVPQNNTTFVVNGQESVSPVAAAASRRDRTLTFADRVVYQRRSRKFIGGSASGRKRTAASSRRWIR